MRNGARPDFVFAIRFRCLDSILIPDSISAPGLDFCSYTRFRPLNLISTSNVMCISVNFSSDELVVGWTSLNKYIHQQLSLWFQFVQFPWVHNIQMTKKEGPLLSTTLCRSSENDFFTKSLKRKKRNTNHQMKHLVAVERNYVVMGMRWRAKVMNK